MTHLYITCENWEGLKGIKEPQISAQDQQERNLLESKIPPSKKERGKQELPPSKIRKRLSSPNWWIIQHENTEDKEDHFHSKVRDRGK